MLTQGCGLKNERSFFTIHKCQGPFCTVKHSFPKIHPGSISDTWKPILLHCILKSLKLQHTPYLKSQVTVYITDMISRKRKSFTFSPSNTSRHAISFNWFNTHNHIKISWKAQLKCYFTYLHSCLWRLLTIEIQLILGTVLPFLNYRFPLVDGESHIGSLSPKTPVIFLTRRTCWWVSSSSACHLALWMFLRKYS